MEEQRETGTCCFFPVVSMYLLMATLLATASPYALMKGKFTDGTPLAALLLGCCITTSLFHVGQSFVSQVSRLQGKVTFCFYNEIIYEK